MPYKASKLETAYRIAAVQVVLLNDRNEPEEVVLHVKFRPLTLAKLEEWDATEKKTAQDVVIPREKNGQRGAGSVQPASEPSEDKDILARQLSEVVLDLDLVEDDGVTPKAITLEYLKTLDLGFLKDVARAIYDRAFPEKKELMDLMASSKASSSGT
jgi:hypothetical protein